MKSKHQRKRATVNLKQLILKRTRVSQHQKSKLTMQVSMQINKVRPLHRILPWELKSVRRHVLPL